MDDNLKYKELLKKEGVKFTKNRHAILEVLSNSDGPMTAEDLYNILKEKGLSINLSTIYRTLERLTSKKILMKSNIIDDGKARYELSNDEHTHHVICKGCNKMLPIESCPIAALEKALSDQINFEVTGHRLELYGYCQDCQIKKS